MAPATIRDVAKRAGVGVGTVSRVLNDNPSVADATRRKVLSSVEELDFSPNPIARRLSLRKTLSVAVVVPFFTRPSYVERLRAWSMPWLTASTTSFSSTWKARQSAMTISARSPAASGWMDCS